MSFSDDPVYVNETSNRYWHYFDGRGNNSFDDWWSLDLSGRYQFPIGGKLDGWVKVTVLNVFDNDALVAHQTAGQAVNNAAGTLVWEPFPGFGEARSQFDYQRPRSYLFTLGLTF